MLLKNMEREINYRYLSLLAVEKYTAVAVITLFYRKRMTKIILILICINLREEF